MFNQFFFANLIKARLKLIECFLHNRGLLAIGAFAVVYYFCYYNANLTLTGEAGSNVLIAQRILEGWRPIKDMFIGYNLMWFYPLSGIFEFTGPHLLASRIYFMVLCGISGVLGFLLVRKVTGFATLAAISGGLMILMPGAMYRNNVGFVGALASFALVFGYVVPHRTRLSSILWMGFAGAAMSLCFLIRIEPSLIASSVWIGLIVLYPIGFQGEFLSRLRIVLAGTFLGILAFAGVHAPVVIHAYQRGFGPEFTGQYSSFVNLLTYELQKEIRKINHANEKKPPTSSASDSEILPQHSAAAPISRGSSKPSESSNGVSPRPRLAESFQDGRVSFYPLSIYFPILSAGMLALAGGVFFISGTIVGITESRQAGLAILATTGCALSLFPQYFFFRPDSVHLAEFMVPFYPALGCAAAAGIRLIKNRQIKIAWSGVLIVTIVCLQVIVAFNALFGREGSGSIRIARGKTALFEASGGIRFWVNPKDLSDWQRLRNALDSYTQEGDYLVTYPYIPLLNIMAARPSYQFKLYVDNATEAPNFSEKTICELNQKKPAVVVVNNRDINKTEHSRFKHWAAPLYGHLVENYVLVGTYLKEIEVFVRPDRVTVGQSRFSNE